MYQLSHCPCCNQSDFKQYHAIVAPFIADYVLNLKSQSATLLECKRCSFRFFKERFSAKEIQKLYSEYRSHHYQEIRQKYEFWYTKEINAEMGNDPKEIFIRKKRIQDFVSKKIPLERIGKVLDYGGDRGQFLPDDLGKQKFLYEISNVTPIDGISHLTDMKSLEDHRFDLIILAHVFEHLSDPGVLLNEVKHYLNDENSRLYIEVPFERYIISRFLSFSIYASYLSFLIKLSTLTKLIDFISTVVRIKLNFVPPGFIIKLHEHINFFNESSLVSLLRLHGYNVVHCEVSYKDRVLLCLARKRNYV